VKAERDAQIGALQQERAQLVQQREHFEKEIERIKGRVIDIDNSVKHLQQEKDQKTKVLEEKYNRAIKDKN